MLGFIIGLGSVCLYWHPTRFIRVYRHGDDWVCVCSRVEAEWFRSELNLHMIVKCRGILGPRKDLGDCQEIVCLNRILRWCNEDTTGPERIEYEADPRHAEIYISQLGLNDRTKSFAQPGTKVTGDWLDDGAEISGQDRVLYRSSTMRLVYLGLDRPEIQFAAKECARCMQTPRTSHLKMLKTAGRFLVGAARLVVIYVR